MAKVRQLLIGLASSSALFGLVPALGLGEITLHSALSQPLDAEIELFDVGDLTAEDMRVRLAPADVSLVPGSTGCTSLTTYALPPCCAAAKA